MPTTEGTRAAAEEESNSLKARHTYHLCCLPRDATDTALTSLENLALIRDRATRIREVVQEPEAAKAVTGYTGGPGRSGSAWREVLGATVGVVGTGGEAESGRRGRP